MTDDMTTPAKATRTSRTPKMNNPRKLKTNVLKMAEHAPLVAFLSTLSDGKSLVTPQHRIVAPLAAWIDRNRQEMFLEGYTTVERIMRDLGYGGDMRVTVMQGLEKLRGLGVVSSFEKGEGPDPFTDGLKVRFHRPYKPRRGESARPIRVGPEVTVLIYEAIMSASDGSDAARHIAQKAARAALKVIRA